MKSGVDMLSRTMGLGKRRGMDKVSPVLKGRFDQFSKSMKSKLIVCNKKWVCSLPPFADLFQSNLYRSRNTISS